MMLNRSFVRSAAVCLTISFLLSSGALASGQDAVPAKPAAAVRRKLPLPLIQRDISVANKSSKIMPPVKKEPSRDRYELCLSSNRFVNDNTAEQHGTPPLFELLCYNEQPVGPVWRIRRGSTVKVHLTNKLTGPKDPGFNPGLPPNSLLTAETPHGLCTTNLHTHGLHVSPGGKSDNVFRCIEPIDPKAPPTNGNRYNEFTFEFAIPDDHPSGTFWYHPHKHGSVAYQLSNGLAGALIIEGTPEDGIADLEEIPEIGTAQEQILVIQLYNYANALGKDGKTVAAIDAGTVYNVTPACRSCLDIQFCAPPSDQPTQARAINGVIVPTIEIAPGEVQRWRIIHGSWDALAPLIWVDSNDKPTDDLVFWEIAVDGLATGSMARKSSVDLAPGQRTDVLIKAPDLADETTYFLKIDQVTAAAAPNHIEQDPAILAKVVVKGKPPQGCPTRLPDLSDPKVVKKFAQCRPFKPIRDEELATPPAVGPGLVFSADDNPPDGMPHYYTISRRTFHDSPPLIVRLGTAEEWTISAETGNHPFHIHVNPFQVVSHVDANGNKSAMDVWRDTLYVLSGESYTIRSRFLDFPGDSVLHCHILDHEDQGMMRCVRFIDPNDPNPKPQVPGCPFMPPAAPKLQPCDMAAGQVKINSEGDGLDTLLGKNVILVFFRGIECSHCTRALKALVRAVCDEGVVDAEIVAVSAQALGDVGQAARELNPGKRGTFHLVANESQEAFRQFDCWRADDVAHGLFVIDSAGRIRARYIGQSPFEDATAIARCVTRLSPPRP